MGAQLGSTRKFSAHRGVVRRVRFYPWCYPIWASARLPRIREVGARGAYRPESGCGSPLAPRLRGGPASRLHRRLRDDDRDIVGSAAIERQVHETPGKILGRKSPRAERLDLGVRHVFG